MANPEFKHFECDDPDLGMPQLPGLTDAELDAYLVDKPEPEPANDNIPNQMVLEVEKPKKKKKKKKNKTKKPTEIDVDVIASEIENLEPDNTISILSTLEDGKSVIKIIRDEKSGERFLLVEHTHGATQLQRLKM